MSLIPKQQTIHLPDVDLCVFEWGEPDGQPVLLVHATGFHARCWDQVVARLPQDWHIFAVDMRGHGRSSNSEPFTWKQFGDDLLRVCEHLQLRNAIGVGHSMGGHCVTHVAGHSAEFFKHLILVDPVIFGPDVYRSKRQEQFASVSEHPVARRRNHFASVTEMLDRFADRMPYKVWQPEVFEDYCRYGLLPVSDGEGYELACPGYVEASIYMGNFDANLYQLIKTIDAPTVVLRASPRDPDSQQMDFSASPTWPELADQFPRGQDVHLPQLTHFIAMQDPQLVADFILEGANSPTTVQGECYENQRSHGV